MSAAAKVGPMGLDFGDVDISVTDDWVEDLVGS